MIDDTGGEYARKFFACEFEVRVDRLVRDGESMHEYSKSGGKPAFPTCECDHGARSLES